MRMLIGAAALSLFIASAPALADTKAGVDAWNRGDYVTAVAEWRRAAIAGDADAQFNLGQAYKLGRGVPVDLPMAESWYRRAALQGHPQAEDNYGLALFQDGKREDAVPWLEKAVARGEPRAQLVLGTMLFNGDGVPRDWVRAYALLQRSSAAGLPQGSQTLAEMDKYIPDNQRQQGIALARQYEQQVGRPGYPPEVAGGGGNTARLTIGAIDVPPSSPGASYPQPGKPPKGKPPVIVAAPPAPPQPTPKPVAIAGGWRVQLGAFGDPNNARKLWSEVGDRFAGRQASFVKAGALTKLLVGPYRSKAEAASGCGAVKPCVPVAP
ncbi:MAG: SPOR domain-containing protein [Sphingomonas sp.]